MLSFRAHARFVSNTSRRLPPSVKHGLTLLGGATVAQVIPALAGPLLARLFVPAEFGAFAFIAAIFGVLTPIVCLRYDVAIVLPEADEEAAHLTALCFASAAACAVLSLIGLGVLWQFRSWNEVRTAVPLLLSSVPIGIVLLSFQLVAQSWSLRLHSYQVQSRAVIVQASVTVAAQIGLILVVGNNSYALVLGYLAGYVALVLVYLPVLRHPAVPAIHKYFSRAAMLRVARAYRRFPLYTGPYAFLGQMSVRIVVLALGAFSSARIVGQYAVAQRVIFVPVSTLMGAASQIFYSRAARRLDDPRMPHMVRTVLLVGPLLVGPFFVLVILFAEPVFGVVFGPPWRQAGHFAAILAVPSMVKTLTAWLDRTFDIRNRQGLPLTLEAVYVLIVCVATYLALRLWHSPELAIIAYSAVTVVFYLVWMVCALVVAGFASSLGAQFVIAAGAVTAFMLGVDSLVTWLGFNDLGRFACAALLAVLLFVAGLRLGMERMRAMEQLAP